MRKLTHWLLSAVAMLVAMPVVAQEAFNDTRTDFRDETIYFAMTTRFYDGDPTNNVLCWDGQADQIANNDPCWRGDFAGLIQKLDYLKALGFTAIWITPVVENCSGFDYHGYHASDFSKVDLRYESRKEWGAANDVKFEDLVREAHARKMKIVLDIVLNHTGNFGEAHFAKIFDRSQRISNQAKPEGALIPDESKVGTGYWDLPAGEQFNKRFGYLKNTGGNNLDTHNYWHHYGYGNWDDPTRWWFQIAGDCVDLNTENQQVSDYLVKCYGEFIKMGVDGFRIDTTGHIARLTFNTVFIPEFTKLGEQYKHLRLNEAPFFMYGECCSRFSDVTYRGQANLSCYYYTWDSPADLKAQWNHDGAWWDTQTILEGDGTLYGNMALCDKEPSDQPTSDNAFLKNGQWHQPDYTKASNFWPIDFPVHYNFNNVSSVLGNIKGGDKYYNDATYNVVYVDSHDYCPGPNDGIRFNGGTAQWAENLSFMFTMRGIPCLYYGSEVEFQKGKTIDKGPLMALKETGRAYFGAYLEGDVNIKEFGGDYTASGNVAKTLEGDLCQHIRRLNQIRSAVPALRKGQYTFDDCSANGGWAYKRAYKNESYALVAVNGGATFSNVPAGTYTEIVTGKNYSPVNGTITIDAPKTQGQLRVLVKDFKGWNNDPTKLQVGEHGKFIYDTNPVAHGGNPSFTDNGTTEYYTGDDIVDAPAIRFSPNGGSFRTETIEVTATLNDAATTGWIKVGNGAQQTVTKSGVKFTLGADMAYDQSVTVSWSATGDGETKTGTLSYKKIDPNKGITIYVTGKDGADISGTNLHAWVEGGENLNGAWPGKALTDKTTIDGREFYYQSFEQEKINIIFNRGGQQTGDIKGIDSDRYFEYDGASSANEITVNTTPVPTVKFSPNGGEFVDNVTVKVTVANTTSAWYKIGNGAQTALSNGTTQFSLGAGMNIGETVTVAWSATDGTTTKTGSATFKKIEKVVEPEGITVYYDNSVTKWANVKIHHWSVNATTWPGVDMKKFAENVYVYTVPTGTTGVVFNNGSGDQTNDVNNPQHNHIYKGTGNRNFTDDGVYEAGVDGIEADATDATPVYYNLQGVRVENPVAGAMYIVRQGSKVTKVVL